MEGGDDAEGDALVYEEHEGGDSAESDLDVAALHCGGHPGAAADLDNLYAREAAAALHEVEDLAELSLLEPDAVVLLEVGGVEGGDEEGYLVVVPDVANLDEGEVRGGLGGSGRGRALGDGGSGRGGRAGRGAELPGREGRRGEEEHAYRQFGFHVFTSV